MPGVELVVLGPSAPAGNRTSLIPIEFEPSARRILKNAPRNDSIDGSSWLISVYPIARTYRVARPAVDRDAATGDARRKCPTLPMFPEPIENLASQVGALSASGKASAEHTLP